VVLDQRTGQPLCARVDIAFDAEGDALSVEDLQYDDRPLSNIVACAKLYSGYRLNDDGSREPCVESDLIQLADQIVRTDVAGGSNVVSDWHRGMLDLARRQWQWLSIVFHSSRLAARHPGDRALATEAAYAREVQKKLERDLTLDAHPSRGVLPRHPSSTTRQIDLTGFLNESLNGEFSDASSEMLRALPCAAAQWITPGRRQLFPCQWRSQTVRGLPQPER